MFAVFLRGFVFLTFMFWYSIGIWSYIDEYFREKFIEMLKQENQINTVRIFGNSETCNLLQKPGAGTLLTDKNNSLCAYFVCNLRDYFNEIFFLQKIL